MANCHRCHTCGTPLRQVLDGEEWCSVCQTYRQYQSHGWGAGEYSPCRPVYELSVGYNVKWGTERFFTWEQMIAKVVKLFPDMDAADLHELEQNGELEFDGIKLWIEEV